MTKYRLVVDIVADFGFSDRRATEYTAGRAGSILNSYASRIPWVAQAVLALGNEDTQMSVLSDLLSLLKYRREKKRTELELQKLEQESQQRESLIRPPTDEEIQNYDSKLKLLLEVIKDLPRGGMYYTQDIRYMVVQGLLTFIVLSIPFILSLFLHAKQWLLAVPAIAALLVLLVLELMRAPKSGPFDGSLLYSLKFKLLSIIALSAFFLLSLLWA